MPKEHLICEGVDDLIAQLVPSTFTDILLLSYEKPEPEITISWPSGSPEFGVTDFTAGITVYS